MEAVIRRGAGFAAFLFLLSRKRSRASGAPAFTVVVAGKSKSHFEVGGARASGVGDAASSPGTSQQRTSDIKRPRRPRFELCLLSLQTLKFWPSFG